MPQFPYFARELPANESTSHTKSDTAHWRECFFETLVASSLENSDQELMCYRKTEKVSEILGSLDSVHLGLKACQRDRGPPKLDAGMVAFSKSKPKGDSAPLV